MWQAISLASNNQPEVPVGALLVDVDGEIVATGVNRTIQDSDPTAHAEIVAIREAAQKLSSWRLENTTLIVTLEPCTMCAGAIKTSRIPRVVFGTWDERIGGGGSRYDILRDNRLGPEVEVVPGILPEECSGLLKTYFKKLR